MENQGTNENQAAEDVVEVNRGRLQIVVNRGELAARDEICQSRCVCQSRCCVSRCAPGSDQPGESFGRLTGGRT
jgi:hypothetical protein